ncbi:MAG TPA: DUF5103 domain-containing protein [Flavisolibacter sp.]
MKWCAFLFSFIALHLSTPLFAQEVSVPASIRTIKLYKTGDQTSFPALPLGSTEGLELHFDDLDANIKNYYYSFQLCNADWTPTLLNTFEYTKGFQNVRITNYRVSSLTSSRYVHYQASVPDRNSYPSKSGNYLLKVFLNNNPSSVLFTKRFVVVDNKASLGTQLLQPYNSLFFRTHQKLQIGVTTDPRVQLFSPQDLKIVVLQNNNWQTSLYMDRPTLYRGNYYEYSDEGITAMQAGKEWRWIDLRSYRLMSDRMQSINTRGDTTQVFVKPDVSRNGVPYLFYRDVNGSYTIEAMENINPFWQGEYGLVHFTYQPPGGQKLAGSEVYLFGELTNYAAGGEGLMFYNDDRKAYEKTLYLKQGYYNYTYATLTRNAGGVPDFSATEGNNWITENNYTVLVYYRPFGARADELIGYASLNSSFRQN